MNMKNNVILIIAWDVRKEQKEFHVTSSRWVVHADRLTSSRLQSLSLHSVSSSCASSSEGRGLALFRLEVRVWGLRVVSLTADSDWKEAAEMGAISIQYGLNTDVYRRNAGIIIFKGGSSVTRSL